MNQPKITVLMPVYNSEKYVEYAIESILNQTFADFEFLILNDGSTDATLKKIKKYNDNRIKLINFKVNRGIIFCLNKGIKLARGEYIARQDGDDISLPKRFEKQVNFFKTHEDYGIVGTAIGIINNKRKIGKLIPVIIDDFNIKNELQFENSFAHGSIMIRKILLISNCYNLKAKYYEDYDLWLNIMEYTKMANLPEVLYLWMNNYKGISHTKSKEMNNGVKLLQKKIKTKNINLYQLIKYIYEKKNEYKLNLIILDGKKYKINFIKKYQHYLLRFSIFSFKKLKIYQAFSLFVISFFINPMTYFSVFLKKIVSKYRIIFNE